MFLATGPSLQPPFLSRENMYQEGDASSTIISIFCEEEERLIGFQGGGSADYMGVSCRVYRHKEIRQNLDHSGLLSPFSPSLASESLSEGLAQSPPSVWIRMMHCGFTQNSPNRPSPCCLHYTQGCQDSWWFLPVWINFMGYNCLVQGAFLKS